MKQSVNTNQGKAKRSSIIIAMVLLAIVLFFFVSTFFIMGRAV